MVPQELVDGFQHFAHNKREVGRAWLLGSRALGTATTNSDWDVALELRMPTDKARHRFAGEVDTWTRQLTKATKLTIDLKLFNTPETPDIEKALRGCGRLFFIPRPALVHEVGHLVVGDAAGNNEQGIIFGFNQLKPDEMAGCAGMPRHPEIGMKRSLAGATACLLVSPEAFPDELVKALGFSVLPSASHPGREILLDQANVALTGMSTDTTYARAFAERICGRDDEKIDTLLREQEGWVRSAIADRVRAIEAVVADIQAWLRDEDPGDNRMMLYPGHRALKIIHG